MQNGWQSTMILLKPCRTTEPDAQEAMLEQLKTWEESEHGMDK